VQEVKAVLNGARDSVRAYRLAKDKVNVYKQLLTSGKTARYESDGSTHEQNGNPIERAYCCLADYQAEADRLMMEMLGVRQQVEKVIGTVPDAVQREVLTRRYIIGQKWEDIAFVMNYNVRHIYKIHGAALQSMALNGTITL
jgi:hypothetical protein